MLSLHQYFSYNKKKVSSGQNCETYLIKVHTHAQLDKPSPTLLPSICNSKSNPERRVWWIVSPRSNETAQTLTSMRVYTCAHRRRERKMEREREKEGGGVEGREPWDDADPFLPPQAERTNPSVCPQHSNSSCQPPKTHEPRLVKTCVNLQSESSRPEVKVTQNFRA